MEDNNSNNSNNINNSNSSSETSPSNTPILSKRGHFNPDITQKQNANSNNSSYIPGPTAFGHQEQPMNQPPYGYAPTNSQLKHSGIGISSFVISIAAFIAGILSLVLIITGTASLIESNPANLDQLTDSTAVAEMLANGELGSGATSLMIGSVLMFLVFALAFVGGILGIVAVIQKNRKKVFSILGLVFNGLIFCSFIFLLLIGLANAI